MLRSRVIVVAIVVGFVVVSQLSSSTVGTAGPFGLALAILALIVGRMGKGRFVIFFQRALG